MPSVAGDLGDSRDLSARARRYANAVVYGDEWPLTPDHVNLDRVTFETSTRMERRHGVCSSDGNGNCTIRLSEKTRERAGFEAMKETIRHELVHAFQYQTPGVVGGHGDSFERWVDPLDLEGRCNTLYDPRPEDYAYRFYCEDGCGFVGGRYRWCRAVRCAIGGTYVCGECESALRVETEDGVVGTVLGEETGPDADEERLRYQFYCTNCGFVGGRERLCATVRAVANGEGYCRACHSLDVAVRDDDGAVLAESDPDRDERNS